MTDDQAAALLDDFVNYVEEHLVPRVLADVRTAIETVERREQEHRWWNRIGDYLREAAVLVLIFAPLDLLIPALLRTDGARPAWLHSPKWIAVFFVLTLCLSFGMLSIGIWLEGRSK